LPESVVPIATPTYLDRQSRRPIHRAADLPRRG
jgi:hypothetical protein